MLQVSHEEVTYMIYGHETGASGTPHLQGYLELDKRMSMKQVKKLFNVDRMHLEPRRGTQAQAVEYCKKEENDIYERGAPARQAGRPAANSQKNKILPYATDIKRSLKEFAEHPEATFHLLKHAKEYLALTESPRKRDDKPTVIWLWGSTGTGKTRKACDMADDMGLEPFIKSGTYRWFDGYDAHRFVIFDDFRDSQCEFGFLLRLLDRYPLRVEIKGGTRQWKPHTIVITSPMPPEETYKTMQQNDRYDKIQQLIRRIDITEHILSYERQEKQHPQTPQGGPTRIDISNVDLITPPKFLYPVMRSPGNLNLPRPLPHLQEDFESLLQVPSITQDWTHPDSE